VASAVIVIIPRHVVGAYLADKTCPVDVVVPDRVGLVRGHPRQTARHVLVILRDRGAGGLLGTHPVAVVAVGRGRAACGGETGQIVQPVPAEGVAAGGAVGAISAGLVAVVVIAVVYPGCRRHTSGTVIIPTNSGTASHNDLYSSGLSSR